MGDTFLPQFLAVPLFGIRSWKLIILGPIGGQVCPTFRKQVPEYYNFEAFRPTFRKQVLEYNNIGAICPTFRKQVSENNNIGANLSQFSVTGPKNINIGARGSPSVPLFRTRSKNIFLCLVQKSGTNRPRIKIFLGPGSEKRDKLRLLGPFVLIYFLICCRKF